MRSVSVWSVSVSCVDGLGGVDVIGVLGVFVRSAWLRPF